MTRKNRSFHCLRRPIERRPDRRQGAEARDAGIPCIALFPNTPEHLRSERAEEALNSDNLVCRAIRAIRTRFRTSEFLPMSHSIPIPPTATTVLSTMAEMSLMIDGRSPRRTGACSSRCGGGYRCTFRHDGPARSCDPGSARGRGTSERRDHGLRRKICLGILWSVS